MELWLATHVINAEARQCRCIFFVMPIGAELAACCRVSAEINVQAQFELHPVQMVCQSLDPIWEQGQVRLKLASRAGAIREPNTGIQIHVLEASVPKASRDHSRGDIVDERLVDGVLEIVPGVGHHE